MKIAIFIDNFLPGVGGTENAVFNYANIMYIDNEVMIFAPDYHRDFDDGKFPFKVVRVKSIALTKNDNLSLPKYHNIIKKRLLEFKPDIIHTETLGPIAVFGIKYGKKKNIPVVSTVHTKYLYCYNHAIHIPFISKIIVRHFAKKLNKSDIVSTVSHDMINELNNYGVKKEIIVVKNGGVKRNNNFEKNTNDKFTCLFVGLVIKYKNIKLSLDALKKVKDNGKDFIFNIVGDGQDRKYFEKYVKKLGLQNQVKFLGRITNSEKLDKIYSETDLFLFPSIFDNDPLVICEAGNMGTPSLVLENTGASERIINNQNGFISKNNIDEFANRIIELMDNKELLIQVGNNSKNLFTTWQENKDEYVKIYTKLLRG